MKYIVLISLVAWLSVHTARAQNKADDIVGVWLTAGDKPGKIQIFKSGNRYDGKIAWMQNPNANGRPKIDTKNPDKDKRNRPILGLVILTGFEFTGAGEWQNGKIYDPESGKTYSCYLSLKNANTLKVRGYVGVSLLGRTEIWTRNSL